MGQPLWSKRVFGLFQRLGDLSWPGDLIFDDLALNFLQSMRNRFMIRCAKNGGAVRRYFLDIGEKPVGEERKNASPSTAWVKHTNGCTLTQAHAHTTTQSIHYSARE